jgi:hypothetical protein
MECLRSEQGFVLICAIFFLILLTIVGILATDTTNIELQIASNDRINKMDFYNQEMGLVTGKINYKAWINELLGNDERTAHFTGDSEVKNAAGETIGVYRVRDISLSPANIDWEDNDDFGGSSNHPANKVPLISYRDKPIPGSHYDPKNFEIRRFLITSYSGSDDRKVILQEGVFKAFNRNN